MCNHWLMYLSVSYPCGVCVSGCVCVCVWIYGKVCVSVWVRNMRLFFVCDINVRLCRHIISVGINVCWFEYPQYDHHQYNIIYNTSGSHGDLIPLRPCSIAPIYCPVVNFVKTVIFWFVCFLCARFWSALIGLCMYVAERSYPYQIWPSDSIRFHRIQSDLVDFGQIRSDFDICLFGRIRSDLDFCWIWSDLVGFSLTWSDLVGFSRTWSNSVRLGRILILINLVRFGRDSFWEETLSTNRLIQLHAENILNCNQGWYTSNILNMMEVILGVTLRNICSGNIPLLMAWYPKIWPFGRKILSHCLIPEQYQ